MTRRQVDATPATGEAPPYGIGAIALEPELTPQDVADLLGLLPDEAAGLTRRDITADDAGVTAVYLDDADPNAPRFGVIVAVPVEPTADAEATVAALERDRWGDPSGHALTGSGDGTDGSPAYREFSRSFPPGQFALPFRPVFFLLWYRAGDRYAFMIVADSAATREALARATAVALR